MRNKTFILVTTLATVSGNVLADSIVVDNSNDSGYGSFRAAIEAANSDPNIDRIHFSDIFTIDLVSEVVFTGAQDLVIEGGGSTLSGETAADDIDTWDSGLLVATGGADLTIEDLAFVHSFNNGLAVFLPEGSDDVSIKLDNVSVSESQFFGVLVDGQATTGFNTDDILHYACTDPHLVDAGISIHMTVTGGEIVNNGRLDGGFDISLATGCPQDFDGLRVDQGGDGDLHALLIDSIFDGNLADGVELDEKGEGGVDAEVWGSTFNDNGLTQPILCDDEAQCGNDVGDYIEDLDDGFDIDEENAGDLKASVAYSDVNANNDEGLDFDEAGEGGIDVEIKHVYAEGNEDEALKASEEDGGNLVVEIKDSTFINGGDDGTQLEEEGEGSVNVEVKSSTVADNGKAGVKVEEADGGDIHAEVKFSSITGNDEAGVEVESDDGMGKLEIKKTDLDGNNEPFVTNVEYEVK